MSARGSRFRSSTMADHVGACAAVLMPLYELIKAHVFAAERIHGDDTTVPVLAKVQDADRPALGLCARRPALWRPRSAGGGVLLLGRSHRASIPSGTSPATAAFCRPTPMRGSTRSTSRIERAGRSRKRPAGRMRGASSSSSPMSPRRRAIEEHGRALADGDGGGAEDRRDLRGRARDQWTSAR